ncbi:uncharacterized protein LOC125224946 [Leguminivora glycinivorella]|uniref:uncharacterized protein LOC125224946 n=1 Tax=Leguminivora glycinivorella TaxID=1035111 RepID=UPI00200C70A3|nr:uncharacterized protein LOC125224946 [Leguminivora glycinivorella]
MYHGHIDVHLLSPKQLQTELNTIARHLASKLALPEINDNIRNLYKLLQIQARLTDQYLIIEVKIPLLSDEIYEIDRLISIPQHVSPDNVIQVIPGTDLIAFNINQDTFIPMESTNINRCTQMNGKKVLCHLNNPIYDVQQGKSICNTEILNHQKKHDSYCHTETKPCADKWYKLHKQNTWLFACCEECLVRILCPDGLATKVLHSNGLIQLGQGCVLKGDTFMLYANKDYIEEAFTDLDPHNLLLEVSPLNNVLNTSLAQMTFHNETHEQEFQQLHRDIQMLSFVRHPVSTT